MPFASSVCYYCKKQYRGGEASRARTVQLLSGCHGPPTTEEIIAYGLDPTPDGKAAHAALSPDSLKAHEACCNWMHGINLRVADVRRSRSAGLDERPPAVRHSRQASTAAVKAEQLATEAAALGAGPSSAEQPRDPGTTPEPMELEAGSTSTEAQHGSSSAAGATSTQARQASVAGAASSQLAGAVQVKSAALPAQRRKGIIDPSRPLHTLKYGPLLRVAKQRATERNTFRKQLHRTFDQYEKVCAHHSNLWRAFPH